MFLKQIFASVLRLFFKIDVFEHHFFGVHKRLIKPFNLFEGVTKTIKFKNDLVLDLEIKDWIPQQLYLLGKYEEKELKFLEKSLRPGDVFVDIGANIGLFSLVASGFVKETGKIYAFEPFSSNFAKLISHISQNDIKNIVAEKLAITSGRSPVLLRGINDGSNTGMISEFNAGDKIEENISEASETITPTSESVPATSATVTAGSETVPAGSETVPTASETVMATSETVPAASETVTATSLDNYKSLHISQPVRFIKMDIEGGEYNALQGMQSILTNDRPILLIELDDRLLVKAGSSSKAIEEWLSRFDYIKGYLDNNGKMIDVKSIGDDSFNCVFLPLSV